MKTETAIQHYQRQLGPNATRADGVRALAQALKVGRHAIYMWGERVPLRRRYQLQVITGGALRAE